MKIVFFFIFGFVVFIFVGITGTAFIIEAPLMMLFGWIGFLKNIILYARPEPLVILEGIGAVAFLCAGLHLFLSKICADAGASERNSGSPGNFQWKPGWTISGLSVFILMFVTSIAVTGIIHQTGWLFRGPLLKSSWDTSRTHTSMKRIGTALESYRSDNGQYPVTSGSIDIQDAGIFGQYIRDDAHDAWEMPFQYSSDGQTYTLRSYGKNRILGGGKGKFDDIVCVDGNFLTNRRKR